MRSLPRVRLGAAIGVPLLAVLIGACGGSGGPSRTAASSATTATAAVTGTSATAAATPTPAPSASAAPVAHLANGDKGGTTRVPVGATVDVTLTPDPGYHYSAPASSDQAVLRQATSSVSPGAVSAEFRALQAGTSVLTAVEDPNCLPRCGLPSRLWQATVVVTS